MRRQNRGVWEHPQGCDFSSPRPEGRRPELHLPQESQALSHGSSSPPAVWAPPPARPRAEVTRKPLINCRQLTPVARGVR